MLPQTPNSSRKRMNCASTCGSQQQQTSDATVRVSKRRQITNPFISHAGCVICMETELQLVRLGSCGHAVCRSCMASALLHAFKLQQLPLRCPVPTCKAHLQLQPAARLLEQQVPGSSALAAKALVAAASDLALIPHHLLCTCPYSDCQVPLELPDDPLPDVPLDCPSCQRAVCSTCRSKWHSGLSCSQHQTLLAAKRMRAAGRQQDMHHQQQQQQQQQLHGAVMLTRSAAAAAAAAAGTPGPLAGDYGGGGGGGGSAWSHGEGQQRAAWQHQQQQQQQQHSTRQQAQEQAMSGGSVDAMMWSSVKGSQ